MELLKLLSANEIVAQIVSFLVLFFILRAFVWEKILKLLDSRKERIADEFKKIEDTKLEIEALKSGYQDKLNIIEESARNMIKEAAKEAGVLADTIKKQAYLDSERIIENTKVQVSLELEKAREELKNQIIDLTIESTEKVIKERMDDEHDKKLVADFIERLDSVK